ncbi:adenylyltransferase and sulfurtransferase MOCS3 isoform X2 [Agrilus planipennis]|uniref:Adenylyltransferase and sulfurtransferase MOCS3 homolog n=1 Tax=Agrilus planipennis TaxID=224129 RepID=A0A7F5RFM8_AGRPL|nr:adenylyltransferase and sulfurtransferase MOCS3 isoform X2 [Agrilus planipennis]
MTTNKKELENEIRTLKEILYQKEKELEQLNKVFEKSSNLSPSEISRYSRQIILPSVGVEGQLTLKKSAVLIVGVGGLGCPAGQYLAAAGIGKLDILDSDEVEITNLHRQILHVERNIGETKVKSGYDSLKRLNSNVEVNPLELHANGETLQKVFSENKYDVVVDCTDNVATRYLLNDMCVFNKVPLVSGSALQLEGQLTVYNYKKGLCYRCLFPVPPPPQTVTSCGEGGVLGAIPGVIGVLQALEVIKILLDFPGVLSGRLLIFDGSDTVFRNIKLRQRNPQCVVCGDNPVITKPIDYEQFCGSKAADKVTDIKILNSNDETDVKEFNSITKKIVIDVRQEAEFQMCHLPNSINIPYKNIVKGINLEALNEILTGVNDNEKVYFLCRRGNDSQRAVSLLKEKFNDSCAILLSVAGGLNAYKFLL